MNCQGTGKKPDQLREKIAHILCKFSYSPDTCERCKGDNGGCPDPHDNKVDQVLALFPDIEDQQIEKQMLEEELSNRIEQLQEAEREARRKRGRG